MNFSKRLLFPFLAAIANFAIVGADPYFYENECCCYEQPACWQGFYINGQVGSAWTRHKARFTNANYFNTLGPVELGSRFHFNKEGFIGGGAIGYNYQCGSCVIGIEGGALGANLKKHRASPFFPDSDRYSSRLEWIGNAKLRLGYAYKCFLPFIYGGWAGGQSKLRLRDSSADVLARSKKWINGWTIGGGIDYKLTDNLIIGVAYDYIQFQNTKSLSCPNCGTGVGFGSPRVRSRLVAQTVVFRLSYLFNLNRLCRF